MYLPSYPMCDLVQTVTISVASAPVRCQDHGPPYDVAVRSLRPIDHDSPMPKIFGSWLGTSMRRTLPLNRSVSAFDSANGTCGAHPGRSARPETEDAPPREHLVRCERFTRHVGDAGSETRSSLLLGRF